MGLRPPIWMPASPIVSISTLEPMRGAALPAAGPSGRAGSSLGREPSTADDLPRPEPLDHPVTPGRCG